MSAPPKSTPRSRSSIWTAVWTPRTPPAPSHAVEALPAPDRPAEDAQLRRALAEDSGVDLAHVPAAGCPCYSGWWLRGFGRAACGSGGRRAGGPGALPRLRVRGSGLHGHRDEDETRGSRHGPDRVRECLRRPRGHVRGPLAYVTAEDERPAQALGLHYAGQGTGEPRGRRLGGLERHNRHVLVGASSTASRISADREVRFTDGRAETVTVRRAAPQRSASANQSAISASSMRALATRCRGTRACVPVRRKASTRCSASEETGPPGKRTAPIAMRALS